MADLGIEFEQKDRGKVEEENRSPERGASDFAEAGKTVPPIQKPPSTPASKTSNSAGKPSVFGAIKKVFTKPIHSSENKVKENLALKEVLNKSLPERQTSPEVKPTPAPVSLDSLKNKEEIKKPVHSSGDRAATAEDMNKLKDLIAEKTQTKEVPEDVLKKILE